MFGGGVMKEDLTATEDVVAVEGRYVVEDICE